MRSLVSAASEAGVAAHDREIRSTKGHDAFLVEWDQLGVILEEALGVPGGAIAAGGDGGPGDAKAVAYVSELQGLEA